MGFSAAAVARMRAKAATAAVDEGLGIHPDNVVAVRWFLALQTQWRVTALNTMERAELRRTGLDYGVAEPTARMSGLTTDPDAFTRLRVLEAEALAAWAEAQSK